MRLRDPYFIVLAILGSSSILNAAWMLFAPLSWYNDFPAAIPDYGPFNIHFVRDVGCTFLAFGAGFVWSAFRADYRFPITVLASIFYTLHALVHLQCSMTGCVPASHWLLDTPLIYLPTLLLLFLSFRFWRTTGS